MLQRRRGQRDDRQPGRVGRRELGERLDRTALGLVAPAVGHRPDLLEAERRRDVAGDRVGVDQQDLLAAAELERRREVRGDRRLADAALRVEDRDDRRPALPVAHLDEPAWIIGPEPSSTVIDRMHIASTRQRIASAEYGRVKNSSPTSARTRPSHRVEGPRRQDHQRRDAPRPSWRRP